MKDLSELTRCVEEHYAHNGRTTLPWRTTHDPYAILVSETMLQQTQVIRVIPKFTTWMKNFPTPHALARAPLGDVLRAWSGLGYNRRARSLKQACESIVEHHNGTVPSTYEELVALPGVGPYTASAVLAFAFDIPRPLIETNVRTVFIHHLFPRTRRKITDKEILPLVARSLENKSARIWYSALMDYGSHLKATLGKDRTALHTKSASYTKQKPFKGSARQLRAAILRRVLASGNDGIETQIILTHFAQSHHDTYTALASLTKDGLITIKNNTIYS